MFKCDKCGAVMFNIENENGISFIKCIGCRTIVGTVQAYNPEEDINNLTNGLKNHHKEIMNILNHICNNQAIIDNKINKLVK